MKTLFIISLIIFIPTIILVSQTELRLAAEYYLKQSEKMISDKSSKITTGNNSQTKLYKVTANSLQDIASIPSELGWYKSKWRDSVFRDIFSQDCVWKLLQDR